MAKVLTGPRSQPGRLPPVPLFVNPEFQDHYDQVRQYNYESTLRAPPVPLFVNPEIETIQPQSKESQPTEFQPPKSSPPSGEIPLQPVPQQIARQPQFQQPIPIQRVPQPAPNTVPPQEWPGHFQPVGPNSEPPLYPWTPQSSQNQPPQQGGPRSTKPYQPPEQPPQQDYRQRQQNWQGETDNQRPDYRKKVHQHQHQHQNQHAPTHQIPHHHHHHHHPQQLVQTQLQFPPQFHQHTQIQQIPQQIQHIAVPAQPIPVQQTVVAVQPIPVQQQPVAQTQHNYRRPQDSSPPQTDSTPLDPGIAALLAVVPTAKIASGGPVESDYDRDDEGEGRAVYCYNCGGTDHTVKNCKKPLFCTFCSKWGHTSNVCFKKKGDNPFNKSLDEVKAKAEGEAPPPPREARFKGCFNCGGEDHTVKDCQEKLYCTVCNKDGHTANKCKRCHNCGGHHMLKECQLPRQCKQCGSSKHTANVCTEIIKKPTEQTQDPPKEDEKPSEEPNQEKKEESTPPQEQNTEAAAVVE
eukprot:NODE_1509_length_1924_cov_86.608551_g1279_i0.p1 GENE.NODE_1509_length_1924_cov_86.608551_g1279_i0~~NODE_1509_length_1924_cov_86.608551_g1279_i0.p1  ORF type:complete len:519 (+),score=144.62 NODE_1509_length_1924_cov_86.608551_g1279_i0:61-1617(+)